MKLKNLILHYAQGHVSNSLTSNFLTSVLFYLSILIFIIAFNFSDALTPPAGGWYQQWMPNLNGASIRDITFTDSLNGYAVTSIGGSNSYILKTINGGDNWTIKFTHNQPFVRVEFINSNTGFTNAFTTIFKTTNAGESWTPINLPDIFGFDMFVLNQDTIWLAGGNGFYVAVFRTTNGGASWQEQLIWGSLQNTNIYMYNSRIGFASLSFPASIWKTTNSGLNWSNIINESFTYMYFIDSLNGWKTNGILKKTTDGGFNWITQVMPSGGYIFTNQVLKFTIINKDTLWGVGGYMQYEYPPLKLRGIIYKTINGGLNWGFQLPDTHTVTCTVYGYINFTDKNVGWAYNGYNGVHTITGGDTITYMGIIKKSNNVPKEFELKQNYPNPFNPRTVIPYSLKKPAHVKLIAYDILGKEVQVMVDNYQLAGEYEVDFMGKFTASGVYFYRIEVTNDKQKQLYVETKRMILIK